MSLVKFFSPENRLGKAIIAPGGKKIEAAIADADEQIHLATDENAAKIDELLEHISRAAGERGSGQLDAIYKGVREVAGMAGIAGLNDLGQAAHIFCRLLDIALQKNGLSDEQIQVNLGVMRLLRQPERFSEAERQALLDNLKAVLEKAQRTGA